MTTKTLCFDTNICRLATRLTKRGVLILDSQVLQSAASPSSRWRIDLTTPPSLSVCSYSSIVGNDILKFAWGKSRSTRSESHGFSQDIQDEVEFCC